MNNSKMLRSIALIVLFTFVFSIIGTGIQVGPYGNIPAYAADDEVETALQDESNYEGDLPPLEEGERSGEVVIPLATVQSDSDSYTVAMDVYSVTQDVYGVDTGMSISGLDYFHVDQLMVEYGFNIFFDEPATGEIYVNLLDDQKETVLSSPKYVLESSEYALINIYKNEKLAPGNYFLEVVKDGVALNAETLHPVIVTDRPIITNIDEISSESGKTAVPGADEVFLEIKGYGLEHPEDLEVSIVDGSGNEIGSSTVSRLEKKLHIGKTTCHYKIELFDGYLLDGGDNYSVKIKAKDGGDVYVTSLYSSVNVSTYPTIYAVDAKEGLVGKVSLSMSNIPAGSYQVELSKQGSNWQTVQTLKTTASYDGLGVLDVQMLDAGQPAYLEGTYYVYLKDDEGSEIAQSFTNIQYDDSFFGDYHADMAVIDMMPMYLKADALENNIEVTATVANISAEGAKIELVETEADGTPLAVVADTEDVRFTGTSDEKAYRFNNLYTLKGNITVSGLSAKKQYRWKISGKNSDNQDRYFIYSEPVSIFEKPVADKIRIVNGMTNAGPHGHVEEKDVYSSSYYVGTGEEEISFSIDAPFMMDDIAKMDSQLTNDEGTVVGTLDAGSAAVVNNQIHGRVDLIQELTGDTEYYLVVTYEGAEAGRVTVKATDVVGAQTLSINQYDDSWVFAAGNSFMFRLKNAFNMDLSNLQVKLAALNGTSTIDVDVNAQRKGNDIVVLCEADEQLSGFYTASFAYGYQPINIIATYEDFGSYGTFEDQILYFTQDAFVNDAEHGSEGYDFIGGGFVSSKNYQVAFYKSKNPVKEVGVFNASYVGKDTLRVPEDSLNGYPKGEYNAYVLENGNILPETQDITLVLQVDEKNVVQPVVSINGGATATLSQDVTIKINGGSFNRVRIANTEEALQSEAYTDIRSSISHQLTEGYGKKMVYFQFKDSDGLESNVITASIEYTSSDVPVPGEYGISENTISADKKVTLWVKSGYVPAVAIAEFYDKEGASILQETLPKSMSSQGMNTYSKTVMIDGRFAEAAKVAFYIKDALTGTPSPTAETNVTYQDTLFISQVYTHADMAYLSRRYIRQDGNIKLSLYGKPSVNASANIVYTQGGQEKTLKVDLDEQSIGKYAGNTAVPEGAEVIKEVRYVLASKLTSDTAEYVENINMPVTSSVRFSGLPNGDGTYDGMNIVLTNNQNYYRKYVSVEKASEFTVSDLEEGEYNYSLTDWSCVYASGIITLSNGNETGVSLTDAKKPVSLTVGITGADVKAKVQYTVTDAENNTRYESRAAGDELTGLVQGDRVTYRISLGRDALYLYKEPDEKTVTMGGTNQTENVALEELSKVTLTGRVMDSAVGRDGSTLSVQGAAISINQYVVNGYAGFYHNETAVTDEEGRFMITAYQGAAADISVNKDGYETLWSTLAASDVPGNKVLEDYTLKFKDTLMVDVGLLVAPSVLPEGTQEFVPASPNRIYVSAYKGDTRVDSYYSSYLGKLYLQDEKGLKAGDTITVKAYAYDLELEQTDMELSLNRYIGGKVEFRGTDRGYLIGVPKNAENENTPWHMLLFDDSGYKSAYITGTGALTTYGKFLKKGDYTAVFFSGNDLTKVQRISRLKHLDDLQLAEGVHYIKKDVSIDDGVITDIGNVTVPTSGNDAFGYLSTDGTSINAKLVEVTSDGKVKAAVTIRYGLSDRVKDSAYTINSIQVNLGTSGTIDSKEFYLNGEKHTTTDDRNIYQATDGALRKEGVLSFTAILSDEGSLNINAYTYIYWPGGSSNENIGNQSFNMPAVTIRAPEEVLSGSDQKVLVRGVGYKDKEVEILDNDVVVGKAQVNSRGNWETYIQLVDSQNPGMHQLQARIEDGDTDIVSNMAYIQVISDTTPRVAHITVTQPYHFSFHADDASESTLSHIAGINPNMDVSAKYKILNATADDVDYTGLVNEFNGVTTLLPAVYNEDSGYWELTGRIGRPGELSVVFALRENCDVSYLTGSTSIDVENLPDNARVEPASLPGYIRNGKVTVTEDGSSNDDHISATMALDGGGTITFTGTHTEVTQLPDDSRFIKLDTAQGSYYTAAPEVVTYPNGDIKVTKTVYFERDLFEKIVGPSGGNDVSVRSIVQKASGLAEMPGQSGYVLEAVRQVPFRLANESEVGGTSTTQKVLDKCDYVSYVSGVVDVVVETSQNPNALGRVGTGMTVFGGAVLAGQVLLGRIGKDPAELRNAASAIESSVERKRIMSFIDEYAAATRKSHYVNSLIGGVSYGASFFGALGKGLSYVVSTGGQVYGTKIGSEYETWADAIITMIRAELAKQERDKKKKIGKKKKIAEPKWKIDPSGYVFEASESERIADVTATVLLKDGDSFRVWDEAEDWEEKNPVTTDENGKYGWDVPSGDWKVRFEKEGYQTYETKAMTVPPLHDQVNIGLLSSKAPHVEQIEIFPDGAEISFDMYMNPDSLENSIVVYDSEGAIVPCKELTVIDAVYNTGYTGEGDYSDIVLSAEQFAKKVLFVPDLPTGSFNLYDSNGEATVAYDVTVSGDVMSYAGVPMGSADTETVVVQERAQNQNIVSVVNPAPRTVDYGTGFGSLNLPSEVAVTLEDSTAVNVGVTWQQGSYNGNIAGTYNIAGTLTLYDGVTNTSNIKASISITVQGKSSAPLGGGGSAAPVQKTAAELNTSLGQDGVMEVALKMSTEISSGKASAMVEEQQMKDLVKALEDIKGNAVAVLEIDMPSNANALTVSVSQNAFEAIAQSKSEGIKLSTGIGAITFDKTAVQTINAAADGDIDISITALDAKELPEDVKAAIGDHPVLNLEVTSGGQSISDFNGGAAQVEIPYELKAGEDANAIIIYFIDSNGKLNEVKASGYDPVRKVVTFTTTHFSKYAVGYSPVSFSDTNMWAKDSITYLAARGIISGIGDGRFEPDRSVTRAEFIKLLIGSNDNIVLNSGETSAFSDVDASQWYAPYIVWAAQNKIINGYGDGRFGPSDTITREQMAVIIDKFTKVVDLQLPQDQTEKSFNDAQQISSWAKQAVQRMQKAGVISGKTGNNYDAKGFATRAEAAKVIQRILNLSIMR